MGWLDDAPIAQVTELRRRQPALLAQGPVGNRAQLLMGEAGTGHPEIQNRRKVLPAHQVTAGGKLAAWGQGVGHGRSWWRGQVGPIERLAKVGGDFHKATVSL